MLHVLLSPVSWRKRETGLSPDSPSSPARVTLSALD